MAFWSLQSGQGKVAVIAETGATLDYTKLARLADELSAKLPGSGTGRTVGFLLFARNFDAVALYLGALRSRRHVPLLLPPGIHAGLLANLIASYQPDWLATGVDAPSPNGYAEVHRAESLKIHAPMLRSGAAEPHEPLALLLSTSGSTGSQKLVRLSYAAMDANARSIVQYLRLVGTDRAITTLELSYSFGLSILNSHLEAGASIVLTEQTLLSHGFWELARKRQITSLSGVPSQFMMLRRAGWDKQGLRSLRMLTQAGGNLVQPVKRELKLASDSMGIEFFVMYGQTEAAPRISYVPPERLGDKLGSIGIPVPGGSLELDACTSELIYRGPNVMLGYAEGRDDLAKGDELDGVLRTGDLARRDEEGFFYLVGRLKRFIKLAGARVNLDDLEALLVTAFGTQLACVGVDERLTVVLSEGTIPTDADICQLLRDRCDIYPGLVRIERRRELPYTASGKVDYPALMHAGR
jgi:long-chain acyl-CoA synthetase